jgi:hypothetical protein
MDQNATPNAVRGREYNPARLSDPATANAGMPTPSTQQWTRPHRRAFARHPNPNQTTDAIQSP